MIVQPRKPLSQLRQLRKRRGLSLEAVAFLADVDPATVSRIERGLVTPHTHTLVALARALQVSIARMRELVAEAEAS
jgi:transcriptional regulator with XRE-family HTH domain